MALSPEYLHHFASSGCGPSGGVEIPDITQALRNPGQPTETDGPYHPNGPPPGWAPKAGLALFRRRSKSLEAGPDEVQALLVAGYAPVLGIATTDAFYSPTPPPVISSHGPVRGLHAVLAVGIGQTGGRRCFLIRNSWGATWADLGHAWVDDAFIAQHLRKVLVLAKEVTQWSS